MHDSQGTTQAARAPEVRYLRRPLGAPGWEVAAGPRGADEHLGTLTPFHEESHIRRGRLQVAPWWRARAADGCEVVELDQRGREVRAWQTRREAAQALVRHREEAH